MTVLIRNRPARPRPQAGFSLVELMVAMALSLILLAGVLAIFASSRTTYETTDRLSRLQENGRFALDVIVRDLRSAGYLNCSQRADFTNLLNSPTTLLNNFALPVQGFDAEALDTSVVTSKADNDMLVVRLPRGDIQPVRVVVPFQMKTTTDDIVVPDTSPALLKTGDIVQISDCKSRAVFQITDYTGGVIKHDKVDPDPDANLPGNSTDDLNAAFQVSAELLPMQSVIYYIADKDPVDPVKGPSLWRRVSTSGTPEELVEGVENMQIRFGETVAGALAYRRADEVASWANVRTVRIALLVKSLSEYGTDTDTADYDVLDETVSNPGDRHLRQVFTSTVNIRNTPTS